MDFIERRKHHRYRCEVVVEVQAASEDELCPGTLADICLGGCYISMIAPFPVGTAVTLMFRRSSGEIMIAGRTVTSLPGSGMGIEFSGENSAEIAASVQQLTDTLELSPQEAAPRPKSAAAS